MKRPITINAGKLRSDPGTEADPRKAGKGCRRAFVPDEKGESEHLLYNEEKEYSTLISVAELSENAAAQALEQAEALIKNAERLLESAEEIRRMAAC